MLSLEDEDDPDTEFESGLELIGSGCGTRRCRRDSVLAGDLRELCAPLGQLGALGATIGVHTTLWIATVGALAGLLFLLPSPIRTMHDVPEEAAL